MPRHADSTVRATQLITSTTYSGIERHVLASAIAMAEFDCESDIVAPRGATRLREEAAKVGLRVAPASDATALRLAIAARSSTADVLHVHDGRAAVVGAMVSPRSRSILVRTQHFLEPASLTRPPWRRQLSLGLHRAINRRFRGYVAISETVASATSARNEIDRERVTVIPPAIKLPSAEQAGRAVTGRRSLTEPVVAFVGRLSTERRVDVLLRAMAIVEKEVPSCRLVLAGHGDDEAELRQLAIRLGVTNRVEWSGFVDDPYETYARAHLYVNPSPGEGFGMAMVEAMAMGLPIVAADAPSSREIIAHGITGWLAQANSPESFAAAIVTALADQDNTANLGRVARTRVIEKYGMRHTGELTAALYRSLLAR